MNAALTNYLRRYVSLSPDEDALFQSYLIPAKLKRKEYAFEQGMICNSRYFITKGCMRLFYIDPKGHEQIIHFGLENWWLTDYDSLLNKTQTHFNLQAIEPTELLVLKESDLEEIYQQIPTLERLFRIIMERTYIAGQRRLEYMFSMSSEELYEHFVSVNLAFIQRIPQYMLASYLGMTPEYLSALRKNDKRIS
ncbi:Crp/Fnr family transcriptional regulator [Poritiphilus flavus]|uniref:Cyclic nucleotide-binding domain-containing protein n=1 Tax=Poritiphilus flavus TaxID=2697053 RepID=A0A6L9E995_9FLAO|nr:Crp/Fnr family transcriptional regulator [Poritiphilus flavus]NAS11327.1 cyclic nucleotide-binding domain-containing protein [Poritiphilus flavus]